jgi:hypothetical protein
MEKRPSWDPLSSDFSMSEFWIQVWGGDGGGGGGWAVRAVACGGGLLRVTMTMLWFKVVDGG